MPVGLFRRLLYLLLLLLGTSAHGQAVGVVARVNGADIEVRAFERRVQEYLQAQHTNVGAIRNPEKYRRIQREVLDRMIGEELLWQEASRRDVVATDADVEAAVADIAERFGSVEKFRMRLAIDGWTEAEYAGRIRREVSTRNFVEQALLAGVSVSDTEIHGFYIDNPEQMRRPEQVAVRHILIKLAPGSDAAVVEAARGRIEALRVEAAGGADFAQLARVHSEDSSASNGGDLGFISRGQMVRPFEEAAFALSPAEVSGVVRTIYGLHIIKAEARRGGELIPEAELREPIHDYLYSRKRQQAIRDEIARLRNSAEIEVFWAL
jgi:parvulin-like peptidyl-prolyl isomerase